MSHIPSKAMHHAHVEPAAAIPAPAEPTAWDRVQTYVRATPRSTLIGAGAGLATIAGVASLLLLRSSTPKKPVKRRAPARKRAAATA